MLLLNIVKMHTGLELQTVKNDLSIDLKSEVLMSRGIVERSGSGVELWTLDYEDSGSIPVLRC